MTSEASELTAPSCPLDAVDEATRRLLTAVEGCDPAVVAQPSLLPGWSRGHLLTHLARNADGLLNLLLWARTGIETPQYASQLLREADIAAGAGRPLGEQTADLRTSADRWLGLARAMPADRWSHEVRLRGGRTLPAAEVPWLRLREIEIHHVDLSIGYTPRQWSQSFVARMLPEVVADFDRLAAVEHRPVDAKPMTTDPDRPPPSSFVVETTDTGYRATIGATPTSTVAGPAAAVLAWLLGRTDGDALTGPIPVLPAWS